MTTPTQAAQVEVTAADIATAEKFRRGHGGKYDTEVSCIAQAFAESRAFRIAAQAEIPGAVNDHNAFLPTPGEWMMRNLLELADAVEAASGADQELDCRIAVAVNAGSLEGARKEMSQDVAVVAAGYVQHWFSGRKSLQPARHYTSSLDAAMTLVADHAVLITLSEIKGDGMPHCVLGNPGTSELFEAVADTMPLALTAAALRARAASEQSV